MIIKLANKVRQFYTNECRYSIYTFFVVISKAIYYRVVFKKSILAHPKAIIHGISNIKQGGYLSIGLTNAGFVHKHDVTLLNIRGQFSTVENYRIARGCRIDVGNKGKVIFGKGGYLNANSLIVITDELTVGDNSVISWNCQILDNDFHNIVYENRRETDHRGIKIGNNVWIGCGVRIYKGTVVPNGCVIAADSVVRGRFFEENVLIAGNPAKVVKQNVTWF